MIASFDRKHYQFYSDPIHLDEDMPVILEHLDSDDEYIRYMKYLQKVLA